MRIVVSPALARALFTAAIVTFAAGRGARAQRAGGASAARPKHTPVCAQGVRVFTDRAQAPTPHDTVDIPAPDAPIRVSSPEEAEAAELAMRGRAASVGATGVIVTDETTDEGGMQRVRRSVTGIFAPADSARAQAACKKASAQWLNRGFTAMR